MKCFLSLCSLCAATTLGAQTPAVFDRQHLDFRIQYAAAATNPLAIQIRNADTQLSYETNQVLLVAAAASKYDSLPGGTPFGNAGDPLWVLPQSQEPNLLYLGLSAAGISSGIFTGNTVNFELRSVKGPGHFFAWQTDEFGGFNMKMNTRDGITSADKATPFAGSHEHLNWGFSTNGVYCVTFRASGTRSGESTNIIGAPATFQFNVMPLRPFEIWQSNHWAFATPDAVINPGADADGDGIANAIEYALGTNPTDPQSRAGSKVVLLQSNAALYGALQFTRPKNRTDVIYRMLAADSLAGPWNMVTPETTIADNGATETVTMRDTVQVSSKATRFLRLQVQLVGPANYGCGCF